MSIKISSLSVENVKRVRAVTLTPSESGLTVIGGRNGQGKTSVLDAIAWALGGNKFKPTAPQFDASILPPEISIRLSNGLLVQRKGKNSALTVTDPEGVKHGQQLLDSFVEALALDLPRFMQASDREKAETLLRILGIGEKLAELERREKALYNERLTVGRIADQKAKYAREQPTYPNVPEAPVSAADLIRRQQEILARNGENQRKRLRLDEIRREQQSASERFDALSRELEAARQKLVSLTDDLLIAERDAQDLRDESTAELEADIERIDELNRQIRANLDHDRAEAEAHDYQAQYDALTQQVEAVREERAALLDSAPLPLPELQVMDGALRYRGKSWDCMSGSERLKVATAIVRKLNPNCGFVLLDGLEAMDAQTMNEFGDWLQSEGLQAIATRVSTDARDCTIIIEDGQIQDIPAVPNTPKGWTPGKF